MSESKPRVVFIPGYRENTEAMLAKMKKVRQKAPMKYGSDERFDSLVNSAESFIEQAKEVEAEASENPTGKNYAREFYIACCDNARRAIYTSYDEPLANAGAREAQRNKDKASRPRTLGITEIIERLSSAVDLQPSDLWPEFITALDNESMEPRERTTEKGELQVTYSDENGRSKHLTYGNFGKRLRKAKNNR